MGGSSVLSRGWLLTGPVVLCLHFIGNAINARLIKDTPGFSDVNIGGLVLLWCTRPRLAWMIVVLVPWQAKEAMYFSATASTLLSEVALQIASVSVMGTAVQYARRQKFYHLRSLESAPHGRDAALMYGGALLWLTVLFFALGSCLWAIFGVNETIARLGSRVFGVGRTARGHSKSCKIKSSFWEERRQEISS
jgi:hypothetical protein